MFLDRWGKNVFIERVRSMRCKFRYFYFGEISMSHLKSVRHEAEILIDTIDNLIINDEIWNED